MAIYKVSIVVADGSHPGAILNLSEKPEVGRTIKLGDVIFRIEEVIELMPPRGDFYFYHLTCKRLEKNR
jgi:hypothetical protein